MVNILFKPFRQSKEENTEEEDMPVSPIRRSDKLTVLPGSLRARRIFSSSPQRSPFEEDETASTSSFDTRTDDLYALLGPAPLLWEEDEDEDDAEQATDRSIPSLEDFQEASTVSDDLNRSNELLSEESNESVCSESLESEESRSIADEPVAVEKDHKSNYVERKAPASSDWIRGRKEPIKLPSPVKVKDRVNIFEKEPFKAAWLTPLEI